MVLSPRALSHSFHALTEPLPDKSALNFMPSVSLSMFACIIMGNLTSDYKTEENDTPSQVVTKCQLLMGEARAWEATPFLAVRSLFPIVQKCF